MCKTFGKRANLAERAENGENERFGSETIPTLLGYLVFIIW